MDCLYSLAFIAVFGPLIAMYIEPSLARTLLSWVSYKADIISAVGICMFVAGITAITTYRLRQIKHTNEGTNNIGNTTEG